MLFKLVRVRRIWASNMLFTYLKVAVLILAFVNIVIGLYLNRQKKLAPEIRRLCYVSVIVQLAGLVPVLIYSQEGYLLTMLSFGMFGAGYYVIARPSFVRFNRLD